MSARCLDAAIERLLSKVAQVYNAFSLGINWGPGKTECFVKFRGKHASGCYAKHRRQGKLLFPVPGVSEHTLVAVNQYKHLGSVVSCDGDVVPDAQYKKQNALSTYCPIACSIFGSPHVDDQLKHAFQTSLVESRLFCNVHVVAATAKYISIVNQPYMRVLRRRGGEMRYGEPGTISDFDLRVGASLPSVDCILLKKRLAYLPRLLAFAPPPLRAALHVRVRGRPLTWTRLLLADLAYFHVYHSLRLPDPETAHSVWEEYVLQDEARWHHLVSSVAFGHSVADKGVQPLSDGPPSNFPCAVCNAVAFTSANALAQHSRRAHGVRSPIRQYVPGAVCPVCLTDFRDRVRCLEHLSDSRRPKCRQQLLGGGFPALEPARVAELDAIDCVARRLAQQAKKSHVLADRPAVSSDGKALGRCTQSSR